MTDVIDGRAVFGCSLAAMPDHPLTPVGITRRGLARARGVDIPPLTVVADVEPLPAWIQQGHLVVSCPTCAGTPNEELELVWLAGPHLTYCHICGNAEVGGAWRPVVLPERLEAISAVLARRPLGNRTWRPDETVADLEAENERFGWARSA